jgi:hypothetical protein
MKLVHQLHIHVLAECLPTHNFILCSIVARGSKISGGIKGGYNPATSIPLTDFFTLVQANSG